MAILARRDNSAAKIARAALVTTVPFVIAPEIASPGVCIGVTGNFSCGPLASARIGTYDCPGPGCPAGSVAVFRSTVDFERVVRTNDDGSDTWVKDVEQPIAADLFTKYRENTKVLDCKILLNDQGKHHNISVIARFTPEESTDDLSDPYDVQLVAHKIAYSIKQSIEKNCSVPSNRIIFASVGLEEKLGGEIPEPGWVHVSILSDEFVFEELTRLMALN